MRRAGERGGQFAGGGNRRPAFRSGYAGRQRGELRCRCQLQPRAETSGEHRERGVFDPSRVMSIAGDAEAAKSRVLSGRCRNGTTTAR